jgi:predicted SAM-dependent methyltransferase
MKKNNKIKLNLGCGLNYQPGYINIDDRSEVEPDSVFNICNGLPYEDNSVDEIRAYDFMEHIPQDGVIFVMQEIHRVLKKEGIFDFSIPSTDGRGSFQDPYHRSYWNINSFLYYCEESYHELYPELPRFEILELGDFAASEEEYKIFKVIHTKGKLRPIK